MEYLLILVSIFIINILVEWKYHVHLYHSRKERVTIVLILFVSALLWDWYAIWRGHWVYPGNGLVGLFIARIPVEDFLFFLVVPQSVLVVYKLFDRKIK
ncbi:MAG: lycopene cyclase domain-containing protein [Nanoarchaeota archaeon]|nr:lycopene cyclase domain-containing protein [Nanoarchaeota archaeon]